MRRVSRLTKSRNEESIQTLTKSRYEESIQTAMKSRYPDCDEEQVCVYLLLYYIREITVR